MNKHTRKPVDPLLPPTAGGHQMPRPIAGGDSDPSGPFKTHENPMRCGISSAIFPRSLDDLVDYDRRPFLDEGQVRVRCPECGHIFIEEI